MKIERMRLDAFGRLSSIDTGPGALPGLVVVLGPNEAGKSTIFNFLTSMLYGFYPASRENNPYAPWNGADPAGSLALRLDAGACVEVERRLMSQPTGKLTTGGRVEDLRNRTLPWAEHVPRTVFRQVYALTLADLVGLDEETWGRVQDRIVGSMGAADLRPARHVAADLEREAGELWRPNRRGNQRIRNLQERIRELREQRRGALERDRRLRAIVAEADAARSRLHDVRAERHRARLSVDRVQSLVPIRAQLRRIDGLREDAGDPEDLRGMPADPGERIATLRRSVSDLARRLDELRDERREPEANVAAFDEGARRLSDRAGEIGRFLARAAGVGAQRTHLAALEQESRDLKRRIESAAAPVLGSPVEQVPDEVLTEVAVAELRERVRRLRAARDERRVAEAAATPLGTAAPAHDGRRAVAGGVAALLGGAALVAWGASADHLVGVALGAALLGVGVMLVSDLLRPRRGAPPAVAAARQRLDAAQAAERTARAAVMEMLADLPLHPSVAEEPDDALVTAIERLQELRRDLDERARSAGEISASAAEADREAAALAGALGLDPPADVGSFAHLLERALRKAERAHEGAASAGRELARIDREVVRAEADLARAEGALAELRGRLEREGGGDAAAGARRMHERMQAAERADQLLDEMERAHPDLEEIRTRIRSAEAAGDSWTVDDDDLAGRKARVESLTEEAEALATRAEALDRDAAHLREAETVDAVDGEIAALEEEEQALLQERDRLFVLARVLRQADRRFREEHQPDLMRRAGSYLTDLTEGRYERIVADEASGAGRFHLVGPGAPEPVPLGPPLSTGTLEQAYLSLRLAIVDHLDQGLERLPLFVDEVFVNWDEERRTRGMDLLARVAERRQVFAFTCHPEPARLLAARGARVMSVGADA